MKKFERWTVAYRKRQADRTLLNDRTSPFTVIPNSWRYWAADPHMIESDGKQYVFAELYDRVLRKGVIGYSVIGEEGASCWRVALKAPHHLSYPHLIKHQGSVYMIPESYVANEIAVYKALSFPDRWQKVAVLCADCCAVDSTVLSLGEQAHLLTLRFEDTGERLMLYPFEGDALSENGVCIAANDPNKRPAGHFFKQDGLLIRPAQDCTESYGCALNFYKIHVAGVHDYKEELLLKIDPAELQTDFGKVPQGLHTYNVNEHYEVIDLKDYEYDLLFHFTRPVWFLWRRIKKIFKH